MCKHLSAISAIFMFIFVLPMSPTRAQSENLSNASTGDQEKPSFEVISIKRVPYDDHMSDCDFRPGARFKAHASLKLLIAVAYEIDVLRVLDTPSFIDKFTWDIEAKPEEGKYPLKNGLLNRHLANLMIQSMLEDRFKLKTHRETRIMSGYELTIAKGEPKLKKHEVSGFFRGKDGKPINGTAIMNGSGEIGVFNANLSGFARVLEMTLHRPVVDKTGIEGNYDMKIAWTPEKGRASIAASGQMPSGDPEITIFDAIQEQLGLKLVPAKIPTQVMVVDDAQMPDTN
jgi:uncharacterized protein (TIGR03435 family)